MDKIERMNKEHLYTHWVDSITINILSYLLYCLFLLLLFFSEPFRNKLQTLLPFTSNYPGIHFPKNNELLQYPHNSVITPKKIIGLLVYNTHFMCKSPSLFPEYKILWWFTQDPFRGHSLCACYLLDLLESRTFSGFWVLLWFYFMLQIDLGQRFLFFPNIFLPELSNIQKN